MKKKRKRRLKRGKSFSLFLILYPVRIPVEKNSPKHAARLKMQKTQLRNCKTLVIKILYKNMPVCIA